jgi:hypothetical protein
MTWIPILGPRCQACSSIFSEDSLPARLLERIDCDSASFDYDFDINSISEPRRAVGRGVHDRRVSQNEESSVRRYMTRSGTTRSTATRPARQILSHDEECINEPASPTRLTCRMVLS